MKAYERLESILNSHGFETHEGGLGSRTVRGAKYANVIVTEKHDGFEHNADMTEGWYLGHYEISASISRMGNVMTAEDFAEAAADMARVQALLTETAAADLSFKTDMDGEEME